MKQYRDMTDEEYAEWGRTENELRTKEMATVNSAEALARVKAACAARRKAVKMTRGQALKAILVAQRMERGESLSFAMR